MTKSIPDLTVILKGFRTNKLNFTMSGALDRSNWVTHPEYFTNIIKALSKVQDVREHLQTIETTMCGISVARVRELLDMNGLPNVKISNPF